jgi:hypothetical protein
MVFNNQDGKPSARVGATRFTLILVLLFATAGCASLARPTYPIGIYSVPKSNLPAVSQAGFNLVTGPAEKVYLDYAAQLHLKVLARPGTAAGKDFDATPMRTTIQLWDSHPALWAWCLADEPDLNGVAPDDVRRMQRFAKNLGAHRPTALVLYQGAEALNYGNIADITMVDRYPIPWLPLANFPQHIRLARLGVGKKKPLIAVIQAFDWSYYPKLLPDQKNLRPPTYQELRCMTYCALARGANGLFYYCFDDGQWKAQEHPETWTALKNVVAEVNRRLPLFEAEHIWWSYNHEFTDPASGYNPALESSVCPALLRVTLGNAALPSGQYLLAVNNTDRTFSYRISLPCRVTTEIPVLGEDREAAVMDGWLEDKFGPFDLHIYGPIRALDRSTELRSVKRVRKRNTSQKQPRRERNRPT